MWKLPTWFPRLWPHPSHPQCPAGIPNGRWEGELEGGGSLGLPAAFRRIDSSQWSRLERWRERRGFGFASFFPWTSWKRTPEDSVLTQTAKESPVRTNYKWRGVSKETMAIGWNWGHRKGSQGPFMGPRGYGATPVAFCLLQCMCVFKDALPLIKNASWGIITWKKRKMDWVERGFFFDNFRHTKITEKWAWRNYGCVLHYNASML